MTHRKITPKEQDQAATGLFLIGVAALALFNFWFPGILLLAGGIGLYRYTDTYHRRVAWVLLGVGGVFCLRAMMQWAGLSQWFPVVMVLAGVMLLANVDLTTSPSDDNL